MGVPHYFKYLTSNFSNTVLNNINNDNKIVLYFDFNSIIYDAKNKIECISNKYVYEYLIIDMTINLLDEKISSINLDKIHTIYIAIDGVAPMAKIIQQRQRRYKSVKEREIILEINKKYSRNLNKPFWDSNAISPGTKFMFKLVDNLKYYLNSLQVLYPQIITILDDFTQPGEGEHKLMHHMRDNIVNHNHLNKVIYGLDADLIILALLRNISNTYLYRESSYFPFKTPNDINYLYLDVELLKTNIKNEFNITNDTNFIDYIFLTFLLGNDFIPNLFILKINDNGFEYLKKCYKQTCLKTGEYLIVDSKLNYKFFKEFLYLLNTYSDKILIELNSEYKNWKPYINPKLDDYERRLQLLNYYPYFIKEVDNINISEAGWQNRYNKYWLGNYDNKVLNNMVKNYYEGLEWILDYYLENKCSDWFWYYKFPIAPSINMLTLFNYDTKLLFSNSINNIEVYNLYQLLLILPKQSHRLIPKKYRNIVNNKQFSYLFPTDFKLLTLHKKYYHECYALLPNIEIFVYNQVLNYVLDM
jgi:5'-3' exonuclease